MNEVSCKVFDVLWAPLEKKRVPLDSLVEGTQVALATLRNRKQRIDWADFARVMRNMRPHFTDEEYVEVGRDYLRSPGLKFAFVIARLALSPLDFYRWFSKPREGVGNQMFNCVVPAHRELGGNEIELDLTLPDGFEVCWDFFLISKGNVEEMPRLLGYPRAVVNLTRIPNGGRYQIFVPQGTAVLRRAWRFATRPFVGRAAARELREAHETLIERYEELGDARTKLVSQASQLRIAYSVNSLAQQDLDLEHTLATIARALVEEAGFVWAEISLTQLDERAAFSSPDHVELPEPANADLIEQPLEARGDERIGALRVIPASGADAEERRALLAFIAPSLAIALQNAIYRSGLERLVDERTTELTQARDQLAGTVEQLREAQGARERFFGNISHEIRTPLSIILLAVADIERRAGAALDERARAGLGSVSDAARKLVRLVDELLLLAAGQENKLRTQPEPTDLAALLRSLFIAWRPAAEAAGLELAIDVPDTLVADVDPVALERVASNLVSNAVKYTPAGGQVELRLSADADHLWLSVLDTGPGINAEFASRLFGRFERAAEHRDLQGTGLGLSLAKQLVVAHGGTLEALPREGGGAEMRVTLPASLRRDVAVAARALRVVDPTSLAPPAPEHRVGPRGVSKGTILLAEDDVRLATAVAELLSDEYVVHIAHDGLEAEELVTRHQPQLLITDVDMPGIDGVELSRRFRTHTGDKLAPIIILSAVLDLRTRLAGLEAGAVDYVTKPFDPSELKARVRAQFRMRDLAMRLHRAEQLSTLGVLTAGLAHEFRNPANGVINALPPLLSMLPDELKDPEHGVAQLIDVIGESAQRISVLAQQLLGFRSAAVGLEMRSIPMTELVQHAVRMSQTALTGIELRLDVPKEGMVCAPPLMSHVLTNLLENAGHAAGRGGWVQISGHAEASKISLEISDSGPGVAADLRERIFEPFFTTKAPGVGTGLGLPLARDIVVRHGGVLEVRDLDHRHAFVIELPRETPEVLSARPTNRV